MRARVRPTGPEGGKATTEVATLYAGMPRPLLNFA
jgi:hypothetical protein